MCQLALNSSKNQMKEKSISYLLVMALPERVVAGIEAKLPAEGQYIKNMSARGDERKKTEENQMKGRTNGMKITSNECIVSVLETR